MSCWATGSEWRHGLGGPAKKRERHEVKPTIDMFKNIAGALDTTVGYLLGETKKQDALKDTAMLKRLNDMLLSLMKIKSIFSLH